MQRFFGVVSVVLMAAFLLTPAVVCAEESQAPETPGVAPLLAQQAAAPLFDTVALGAGIVILGAAYGIGRLASASFESMARQPEVANTIRGAMIIAAALIEGATFFALIVCIVAA
jgi:F-type H+-transporting ATPase subunit c